MKPEKAPKLRQSRGVLGLVKLNEKMMNTAAFTMARAQWP